MARKTSPSDLSASGASSPRDDPWIGWIVYGLIIAAACLAYRNAFRGPFVFDDLASIPDNPSIRHLGDILNPPWLAGETVGGRPVLNSSFALNYAISGYEVWSYHALNLLIHLWSGCLVYGLARRLFRSAGLSGWAQIAGGAVALLWTAHPLQTESVTYIVQRAESLVSFFYLLTLYAFVRGGEAESKANGAGQRWFGLSVMACLLGMGAKEVMASAPIVVFLYDRCFISGSVREAWRRHRRQYWALAGTWILVGLLVLHTGGNRGGSTGFGVGVSWGGYLLTQFPAIAHYLRLVFWPTPLVFEHDFVWPSVGDVLPTALVVLTLVGLSLYGLIRNSALGFLGIWFFALLAPSSLVPVAPSAVVEHRMYLALVPVLAALALLVLGRLKENGVTRSAVIVALLLLVGLGVQATARRNEDYRSALSLWGDTVAKAPDQPFALYNYARALMESGDDAGAVKFYRTAMVHRTGFAEAHEGLAFVLARNGDVAGARDEYLAAIAAKAHYADAEFNLGNLFISQGRFAEAAASYEQAARDRPHFAAAELNLANALQAGGEVEQSLAHYRTAIDWDPSSGDAHYNLALALRKLGRGAEAAAEFQRANPSGASR